MRVLFFGDSHTQGEFLPDTVRKGVQKRFGDGGPGFLYAGDKKHRSDAAKVGSIGAWASTPKQPSTSLHEGDDIFGLGGMLVGPTAGSGQVEIDPHGEGRFNWDVCVRRTDPHSTLTVSGSGLESQTVPSGGGGGLEHSSFHTDSPGKLSLSVGDGMQLCGVVGERDPATSPGVVLDSLGIIGARYSTVLAWDQASFEAEVTRRKPDLVILEYGTNESAEKPLQPERVKRDLTGVLERMQRAVPEASCLVIGPTEIESKPEGVLTLSPAIEGVANHLGCAYWDPFQVMGGPGSMKAWRESKPQKAASDGIHFTRDGYEELGKRLLDDMLSRD